MKEKLWTWGVVGVTLVILIFLAMPTYTIDPYFHFHGPNEKYQYKFTDERYLNDGISRHFEYQGIITGTSMVENFKASEFESLFGVQTIKIPFSGGRYLEIDNALRRAIEYNDEVAIILRSLDFHAEYLNGDKDGLGSFDYPTYLYNDNVFDDVNYLLNKNILIEKTFENVIEYGRDGNMTGARPLLWMITQDGQEIGSLVKSMYFKVICEVRW